VFFYGGANGEYPDLVHPANRTSSFIYNNQQDI